MKKNEIVVSFSGGESSAYMAWGLNSNESYVCRFIFANTGQENEETLRFVRECDERWSLGVVWLEAETHHNLRKGCTHKVVDFSTADRDGRCFEEMIVKYGIPNTTWPHCTRELKQGPINSWKRSNGLRGAPTAIGIRSDEFDRMSSKAEKESLIYPLVTGGITKNDVKRFWQKQPFGLGLDEHQGNCKWCWKKSNRKLWTLVKEDAAQFDFPRRMEEQHGLKGHNKDGLNRKFFRNHRSTEDILREAVTVEFAPFTEVDWRYELGFDLEGGCSGGCEIGADN